MCSATACSEKQEGKGEKERCSVGSDWVSCTALPCPSVWLWSSFGCRGRTELQAGVKKAIITSASHLHGGRVLCRAPIQPCSLQSPASASLPGAALGGDRAGVMGLLGPEAVLPLIPSSPHPLHFNTLLHLWLVCIAQNVLSIISVCTFATVCAGCTLKAIKSSFVCLQGNPIFLPHQTNQSSA